MRQVAVVLGLWGCGGSDEPHECDNGTPTCDSSLLVYLPDGRDEFDLTVDLDSVSISAVCPSADGEIVVDEYTAYCGAGQLTIRTFLAFPDTVTVRLESLQPEIHHPDYQKGGDFCGNPCTIGNIQL